MKNLIAAVFVLVGLNAMASVNVPGHTLKNKLHLFGTGVDDIEVYLSEDAYNGDALAKIEIDGVVVDASVSVPVKHNAGSLIKDYQQALAQGAHVVKVTFLNDSYGGPGKDRNLYVDSVWVNRVKVGSFTALKSTGNAGTFNFTIIPPPPAAAGIFIGSTEYQHLADAGAAYKAGDTIHITKSQDNESTVLNNGDVTVVCDPGVKLTWSAGISQRVAWGKGIFDFESAGAHLVVQGCEISGSVLDGPDGGNASAVRLNDNAVSADFENVFFHDNNDGILGGSQTVTINNSRFLHNGVNSGGYANVHNIYISQYAVNLNVANSYFGQVTPAHLFKSRAQNTSVNLCQFETVSNVDGSYLIDIPNGGNVLVQHSVFIKAPNQSQRGTFGYGEEGLVNDGRVNNYEFKNNVVINDGNGRFLDGVTTGVTLNFHDNIYVGPTMDALIDTANNTKFPDRASAGLQPAPALPAAQ